MEPAYHRYLHCLLISTRSCQLTICFSSSHLLRVSLRRWLIMRAPVTVDRASVLHPLFSLACLYPLLAVSSQWAHCPSRDTPCSWGRERISCLRELLRALRVLIQVLMVLLHAHVPVHLVYQSSLIFERSRHILCIFVADRSSWEEVVWHLWLLSLLLRWPLRKSLLLLLLDNDLLWRVK